MTRSLPQLEQTARAYLRTVYATGCDDDAAIEYATRMMGAEHKALVGRVWARDFKIMGPI